VGLKKNSGVCAKREARNRGAATERKEEIQKI